MKLTKALTIQVMLLCALSCGAALAQTQPADSASPSDGAPPLPQTTQGSLESLLTIEDPTARIAALQKFLKTNSLLEQSQIAREALVASHAQLGETQLGENNIERAAEEFRRALAGLPEKITDRFFEETVVRIPLAVSVRGYRGEAINLARQLEKRFAKEPPRLARLGEFYLTIEAPSDAVRALEAASKLAEEEATLHRALGAAYRMNLRLDDAIAEYQQAVSFDAKDKRAYYELANLYRAHGAFADAVKLYKKQLEIEPKHTPSYKGLALALLSQGKDDNAAAALNQARDIRGAAEEVTGDIYLQTQLAFHYLSRSDLKQARQAANAALYVEPRYAWARIAAAEIDMAEGKYFDAEKNLLAAKTNASFPTLFFTLGKLYLAVEDFDGAVEQFAKAFSYSKERQFTARLGNALDVQADTLKELLSREHQAAIFLAEPPTSDEQFKIAESLVKFNVRLRMLKMPAPVNRPARGQSKTEGASDPEARRKQMEELDQAAMSFIEAENARRSFRMLYVARHLANAGVALGLALELVDQALGLAEVATENDGSLREFPNFDRNGRLSIFRGRALDAKGWALFKANKIEAAVIVLNQAVRAYGALSEGKHAIWHLATAREAAGDLKEALDLYIAGYEPAEIPSLDVNRAVIESLYRKVYGSLNGLERRIGAPPVSTLAADTTSARPIAEKRTTGKAPVKKDPLLKPALAPKPAIDPAPREISVQTAIVAANTPPVETKPARPPAVTTPKPERAPVVIEPVKLPAIALPTDTFSLYAPPIDNDMLLFLRAIGISRRPNPSLDAETEAPPPPAPKLHTRKRRVTPIEGQP
jgi:tetratricopeptide (TPR) repeat protein